ncbi:MAG: 16S rRNA (cytosine(1402)-N(4))-methyltransferase RsmH [Ignavibacteria bacterium]|nr:16S rRNA (cytosine(1402)-N(4))-methyltransferase RsmH [Ignavibacteria bacterium]
MENDSFHRPVLLKETLTYLITKKDGVYFDGTLGGGGYSKAVLDNIDQSGTVIATDLDINAINFCKKKFENEKRIIIVNDSYKNVNTVLRDLGVGKISGAVLDLGVSSFQLDSRDSGFSYRIDSKFDLRFNKNIGQSASEILNEFSQKELEEIVKNFGEEKNYKKIVRAIVEKRNQSPIKTTKQVVELISNLVAVNKVNETLSRVFQAFRIFVNSELDNLKSFLSDVIDVIESKGRIVIVSYHSLEDRIVKDFFNYEALSCVCPREIPVCICDKKARIKKLHKKVVFPSEDEIRINSRARSAKLRAVEVL